MSKLFILALVTFLSFTFSAFGSEPFLFVLDMDRLFVKEKAAIYEGDDPSEYIQVGKELYRLAPYTPEFLAALKFYFQKELGAEVKLAIFSAGTKERNQGVVNGIRLNEKTAFYSMVSVVKSFPDLTLIAKLPNSVKREDALSYIKSLGGQDNVPFFEIFSKDLSIFNHDLKRTVIFEDNLNATPSSQTQNLLAVARPDIYETKLYKYAPGSTEHWAEEGQRIPIQVARARYRLVRAIGVLSHAVQLFRDGPYTSLPEALDALQWDADGNFKFNKLNAKEVYEEGMRILKLVYNEQLLPGHPTLVRDPEYFEVRPVIPRTQDCSNSLDFMGGYLPWAKYR